MARHASTSVTAQEEPNSIRTAFLRRATSALERISANASAKDLADALSAPTDAGSLAQLLSRSDMVGAAINDLDPLVPALARNVEHRQNLIERAGGTMSAEDAGRILGISRQAVDKRRRAGTLLAVREGSDWRYPFCQLDQGEVIAGISDVVRGFAAAGPWIALDFLLAPDTVLGGRTPLQALRDGDREAVRRLLRVETSDGFA
ncbi:helix-turn-helix domain-containing protein [Rhizobium leguminosarum]|uniref:helix-turn-helix domain-containing protein n=1 Tax=Rhizobium leguminosarum TaxID=384 RepID=UPI001031BDA4|nr:helix-turn-helix domain-containing protein [Rhizobium leguminosarum]TAY83463.1 DNA-binding protein [Rhizobium leguminosarum]